MVAAFLPAVTAASTIAGGHVSPAGKRIGRRGASSGGDRHLKYRQRPSSQDKGKSVEGRTDMERKAVGTGPVAAGYPDCSNVGNNQLSCYPLSNTTVIQDDWSKLIWNFNYPLFIAGNDTVDVHLFLASSDLLVQSWRDLPNPQGQLAFSPVAEWFESQNRADTVPADGSGNAWGAYFVIVPGGKTLDGGEVHQATFTAQQTAVPTSVALSRLSVSSTASVASASVVSASLASVSATASPSGRSGGGGGGSNNGGSGSLQGNGGGDGFPRWATALLSVLGALLLLALLALMYLCFRRVRRRENRSRQTSVNSLGSASPMMAQRGGGALGVTTGAASGSDGAAPRGDGAISPTSPQDTVSSRQQHQYTAISPTSGGNDPFAGSTGAANPPSLSGADAASISAAYRAALSHPNFAGTPPEGSTPDEETGRGKKGEEVMQRELEAEGMVVRGVKGGTGGDVRDGDA